MPLFVVIGLDHPPNSMALRDAARAEHRAYVLENDAAVRQAGAFLDEAGGQCGSFYLFEADDEQQVRAWLQAEPFVRAGVYAEVIVRRYLPGLSRLAPQDWPARA